MPNCAYSKTSEKIGICGDYRATVNTDRRPAYITFLEYKTSIIDCRKHTTTNLLLLVYFCIYTKSSAPAIYECYGYHVEEHSWSMCLFR